MASPSDIPDIKLDANSLYREEILTDRKAGTIRRLIPIKLDGSPDTTRAVLFSGQTQLLTPRECSRCLSTSRPRLSRTR